MALVLIATPGASTANTYATLAEAETYFESRLHTTTWDAATDATKNEALAMAARLLDTSWEWICLPSNKTQALQWPRNGVLDALKLNNIPSDEIPHLLKEAQSELAAQLIPEDRTLDYAVEAKGIRALRAGSVALEFRDGVAAKVFPDAVVNLIPAHWGYLKAGQVNRPLERT